MCRTARDCPAPNSPALNERVSRHQCTARRAHHFQGRRVEPQSRVLKARDWEYLRALCDATFDCACVWDYGIGVFRR